MAHTVFVADDTIHMRDKWLQLRKCIADCVDVIIETRDRMNQRSIENNEPDDKYCEEFQRLSLYFINSSIRVQNLSRADNVFPAFDCVAPKYPGTPLGTRLARLLHDLSPWPPAYAFPSAPRRPINIIVLTAGDMNADAPSAVDHFQVSLETLDISDRQVSITLYQIGSDRRSANTMELYERTYNNWAGTRRGLMYAEINGNVLPGRLGDGTFDVRKVFKAATRAWETSQSESIR